MARKISFARGRGKLRHNNRDIVSANVDPSRIADNITIVKQDLGDAYKQIFGEAQAAYNAKQKRADRKIDDYFQKLFGRSPTDTVLKNDNKQQSFYEYVVGVGDMHDTGFASNPEMAEKAVECLKEYMRDFSKRNPNFYVFNAVVHKDEATPHMHFDFIPFADGYKTGMTRQQGIAKALEQMGYGKGEKAYINFTQSERNVFREICERHGIEVADEEKGRGETLTTAAYREYAEVKEKTQIAEKNLEQLSTENETKITQVISDFATGKGAKKVAAAEKIIDNAELINSTICKENDLEKQQLAKMRNQLEVIKADMIKTAQAQEQREAALNKAAQTLKANDKRLQQGFARLKATVQREVQRALARLAPFKELLAENDRFKRRMEQVHQAAEKTMRRKKGDIER